MKSISTLAARSPSLQGPTSIDDKELNKVWQLLPPVSFINKETDIQGEEEMF